jgi:tetratricopeptide (TPR) repeat protein
MIKAEKYYIKSLEIRLKLYGENNIDTALSLSNIGLMLKDKGYYDKALENINRSLNIRK